MRAVQTSKGKMIPERNLQLSTSTLIIQLEFVVDFLSSYPTISNLCKPSIPHLPSKAVTSMGRGRGDLKAWQRS